MYRKFLLVPFVPFALGAYSYSYDVPTAAPTSETQAPTATRTPTRTETYAPTRMTEAPSYAPTTDTYAPTYGSCPSLNYLGDPGTCPSETADLQPCNAVGLSNGEFCVGSADICPDQLEPIYAACPVGVVRRARRFLAKVHGPATRAFHGWNRRRLQASAGDDADARRRLATHEPTRHYIQHMCCGNAP